MKQRCTNKKLGQFIALYEFGALDEHDQRAFREHLIECEYCYGQVYALEPLMTSFRKHRSDAKSGEIDHQALARKISSVNRRRLVWRVPALAVSVLAVVALGWAYFSTRNPGPNPNGSGSQQIASRWETLEIPKAAYSLPKEGVTLRNPRKAFDEAMSAYQENDFARAVEQLEIVRELEPGDPGDVSFYLGVSLSLLGRAQDAVPHFNRAVESRNSRYRGGGHYYLALIYLKANQPERAVVELDAAVETDGEYRAPAENLRHQVLESIK